MTRKQRQQQQGHQIMRGVFAACERRKRRKAKAWAQRNSAVITRALQNLANAFKQVTQSLRKAAASITAAAHRYQRRQFIQTLEVRANLLEAK